MWRVRAIGRRGSKRGVASAVTVLALWGPSACNDESVDARDAGSEAAAGDASWDARATDAGADARAGDAKPADARGDVSPADANADSRPADSGSDAESGDAGACAHWQEFCGLFGCPDPSLCKAAVSLQPDVMLTMQDSASGGHGDCAVSASGVGGPSLYYSVTIPAGRYLNLVATPAGAEQRALIRVLSDCSAAKVLTSNIAGGSLPGEAALCLRNEGAQDRRLILAVSRYSGEVGSLPLLFDLLVDVHDSIDDCSGGFFRLL